MFGWLRRAVTAEQFQQKQAAVEQALAAGDLVAAERLARALGELVESRNAARSLLWAEAHYLRGTVFLATGDFDKAIAAMQAAATLAPTSPFSICPRSGARKIVPYSCRGWRWRSIKRGRMSKPAPPTRWQSR